MTASLLTLLTASHTAIAEPHYNVNDYYEVHHEGRIHVFDDLDTYLTFLKVGESAYRLTRIGAGPNGETVVFGLQKKDKKMREGLGGVDMFDGKTEGIKDGFYAEVQKEGRIHVFNDWKELQTFLKVGEAAYRYTDIASGPNSETVVYVLTKAEKKKMPVGMIARFKKNHQL